MLTLLTNSFLSAPVSWEIITIQHIFLRQQDVIKTAEGGLARRGWCVRGVTLYKVVAILEVYRSYLKTNPFFYNIK